MTPNNKYTLTNKARVAFLAGLGLVCVATPARSQDSLPASVYELDAHVTVANRSEMPIQQVGSSVEILESFDLQKGQDRFILDSLRLVPGFYLRNNGGPGGAFGMTVRGLSENRPTVIINGIKVSNPSNGQMINPGNLMSGNVSRVEILKGSQSSLYGANALAGVISIESLGAGDSAGGRASFGLGSYDTYEYGLGHSGSQGAFSWAIDANVYESEGFSNQDPDFGPEWADDDTYDATNLSSVLNYKLSENSEVYLSTYYLDTYSEFDPGVPPLWGTPFGANYSENEEFYAKLGSRFEVAENWKSEASLGYADVNYLSYTGFGYNANGDRYQLEWQNTVEMSESWRFVGGVEHEIEDNRSDVGDLNNTSLFMENLVAVNQQLDLTLGFRHDDNSKYGNEATYRATFSYRIKNTDARIRGSFGSSFQAPTFIQLNPPWGNPNIAPESGKGWDLGYEQAFADGRLFLSSTLFGNDVNDKIGWGGSSYANISEYQSEGLETAIRFQLSPDVRISASHTYSDSEVTGGLEALRVPRNVLSASLYWSTLDDRMGVNLSGIQVSSQFSNAGQRIGGAKQEGYTLVNLAGEYDISEFQSVWIRIGNLLDEDYEEIAGYQTAGRHVNAGMRFKF